MKHRSLQIAGLFLCAAGLVHSANAAQPVDDTSERQALISQLAKAAEPDDPVALERRTARYLVEAAKVQDTNAPAKNWVAIHNEVDALITQNVKRETSMSTLITKLAVENAGLSTSELRHLVAAQQDPVVVKYMRAVRAEKTLAASAHISEQANLQIATLVSSVLRKNGLPPLAPLRLTDQGKKSQ